MRKPLLAGAVGIVLSVGAFAAAQELPRVLVRGDSVFRELPGQTEFTGNARLTVDGVIVEADRIVIQGREVKFEGNVRLTLPSGVRVSELRQVRWSTPAPPRNQP